ncbi:hypothetical protein [Colwellia sp. E2M01]|uniref:hypothetical protein n=1 Tax=Colwellia sp. E2M01 TaxID=2841561 RepID=UPI001C08189B|nr:hypothetical protein [Colwellia sp. E2M01]MBU2871225.1 hypothetical protein [Colwellia sp. E2M01]
MKLFPTKFIIRHQEKLLFIVLLGHVTLLNLFYVTYNGPIFFWAESLQFYTQFIHLMVAAITMGFYFILLKLTKRFNLSKKTKPLRDSVKDSAN